MDILELITSSTPLFLVIVALFSLCIGSFLNVVIYRLPLMMKNAWRLECYEFLEIDADDKTAQQPRFNLVTPRSRCPHCQQLITAWQNIPVISYLFLKGRCASCKAGISIRYPIVELSCAILSVIVAWHFGVSWQTLYALLFTWSLIALTGIDFDHQLLPDSLVYSLLWIGLIISITPVFVDSPTAIIGAASAYLALWSFIKLFKLITGKDGMGHGDFKLFAVFGAWMGWQLLPFILICSSVVGAIVGSIILMTQKKHRSTPIPFGPYLAMAGWIALLWGNDISQWYLRFSGLGN